MADVPDIDLYADDLADDFHGVRTIITNRLSYNFKSVPFLFKLVTFLKRNLSSIIQFWATDIVAWVQYVFFIW